MLSEAGAKIDRGLGNEVVEDAPEAAQNPLTDFQLVTRRTRKPGTGCISELNNHLFEGRYSHTWPDGTKHSKFVYAHTREECEEKLKVLIQQMNADRRAIQNRMRGIIPPDKLTKKHRQIWEYMRLHPDETNYSVIAKGGKATRHTVAKHHGMIQRMVGKYRLCYVTSSDLETRMAVSVVCRSHGMDRLLQPIKSDFKTAVRRKNRNFDTVDIKIAVLILVLIYLQRPNLFYK